MIPSLVLVLALPAAAASMDCDLSAYRAQAGLRAERSGDALIVSWTGERESELRASFAVADGVPVVRELAARRKGGAWQILGRSLVPEFDVTSGRRRISSQQLAPLRELGQLDPSFLEREKWKVFWDAPLQIPGSRTTNADMP